MVERYVITRHPSGHEEHEDRRMRRSVGVLELRRRLDRGWDVVERDCRKQDRETITTGPWSTRDLAEQKALERITGLLGHNEDRSTSRVNNPGESSTDERPVEQREQHQ